MVAIDRKGFQDLMDTLCIRSWWFFRVEYHRERGSVLLAVVGAVFVDAYVVISNGL